jgi:hypothetical protein
VTIEELRPNVLVMTATRQEFGTLAAAARLALDVIAQDADAPPDAAGAIAAVLRDYDAALRRLGG